MINIAPSILAADLLHMGDEIQRMLSAGADVFHLDIMDAHFVPNLSFGPDMVKAVRRAAPKAVMDVHLMMDNPSAYLEAFCKAGADEITVHVEIEEDIPAILSAIHAMGLKAGLSLKPKTPWTALKPYLSLTDLILVMSVEPGFGGQSFMPEMVSKLRSLRDFGYAGVLSIDGGISEGNASLATEAGATRLVMGTALFKAADPAQVMRLSTGKAAKERG